MLEFNIRNQEISRIDNFSPAEKSVEYLIAKFNFKTDDWNEAIKRAIFRNVKSKVEKDAMIENDSCTVPWEVLEGSGAIEVSVHGVIGTEEITTDVAVFNLNRTLQGGSATQEPSPTVYEQMVEMVKDAKEVAQSVRDDADNGKFNGQQGDPGKDGKSAYQYAVEGGFKGTEQEFIDSMGKAGQVDLTGYVTKEQHEAELLKAFVKVTTDKAPYHHITDSANIKVVDFGMEGITEQDTTSGKNLFGLKTENVTKNAYGSIIDIDNGIELQYTDIRDCYCELNYSLLPNTTYTISFDMYINSSNTTSTFYALGVYTDDTIWYQPNVVGMIFTNGEITYTFTTPDTESDIHIVLVGTAMNNGATGVTRFTNFMLSLDSDTTYEPFTNGPSPNPDYKQEIKNAGVYNEKTGRYEHKGMISGQNIFDLENAEIKPNSIFDYTTGEVKAYGSTGNAVLNYWKIVPRITYTVSATENKGSVAGFLEAVLYDSDKKCTRQVGWKRGSFTFTANENEHYIRVWYKDNDVNTLQIEPSPTQTEYKVFDGIQPFTLTSDRPLTMWDKLVKRDGKWYWDYKQLKLVVDGNRAWSVYPNRRGFSLAGVLPSASTERSGFCNALAVRLNYAKDILSLGLGNDYLYATYSSFYDSTLEDKGLANWKAHLNEHPLEIYTYKDESELVPLPDEEQTLLNNLEMYYGVTNIYNEQGCPISITYCADQELHWNQKLLQIQQAII